MIISENKLPEGWLFRLEKECFFKKKKKTMKTTIQTHQPSKKIIKSLPNADEVLEIIYLPYYI